MAGLPGPLPVAGLPSRMPVAGLPASQSPHVAGLPGSLGLLGMPTLPGVHDLAGMTAVAGMTSLAGMPGLAGLPGFPGMPGVSGMPGLPGMPGTPGLPGMLGLPGMPTLPGAPGLPGMLGLLGMPSAPSVPKAPGGFFSLPGTPPALMGAMLEMFGMDAKKMSRPAQHYEPYGGKPSVVLPPNGMPNAEPGISVGSSQNQEAAHSKPTFARGPHEWRAPEKIDADVQELCDHFLITEDRHVRNLDAVMKKRPDTFTEDMERIWQRLEKAHCADGLLCAMIKEMEKGNFQGVHRPCKVLIAMAKKYSLDDMAVTRVADILGRHPEDKKSEYLTDLEKHLEVAGRPSATVMLMLKKISDGKPLGPVSQPPAGKGGGGKGSVGGRDREQSRSERDERDRSRDRRRSRSRDQNRDRERDRDRDRDRR